jgi:hypothetical protein
LEVEKMKKIEQKGKRRTVWLPNELDQKAEEVRKSLGLGLSAFYRFAVVEVVKDFAQNKKPQSDRREA